MHEVMVVTQVGLERSREAWVHLACHRWAACCPSQDWELLLHYSREKPWPRWNVHMSPVDLELRSTDPRIHTTMSAGIQEALLM